MALIVRPTDRPDAVTRVPAPGQRRDSEARRQPPASTPDAEPVLQPGLSAATLEPDLVRLSAVAAATIAEPAGPLIDQAVAVAERHAAEERERAREEARQAGFKEGLAEGRADIEAEWQARLARLDALAGELQGLREQILVDAEDKLVELVYEATTRLIGAALATRDGVAAVARQVLASARDERRVLTIRLSPADYEFLGGTEEAPPRAFRPGVAIVSDPRVEVGGCIIDTEQGSIDGRLDIQLERLKDALADARQRRREA